MKRFRALIFLIVVMANCGFCQINIVSPPQVDFEKRIIKYINHLWIIDTHEHLISEAERIEKAEEIDFTYLFSHYAKEDFITASNEKSLIEFIFGNEFPIEDRWQLF